MGVDGQWSHCLIARFIRKRFYGSGAAGAELPKDAARTWGEGWGYAVAAVAVAGAFLLRMGMDALWADRLAYAWFFLAVLVVARYAGAGPQVATAAAGLVIGNWFFVEPRGSLEIAATVDRINAGIYCGVMAVIMIFAAKSARDAAERERLIAELRAAMAEVKTLSGLLPICAQCKKIRDDRGYWNQIESFIGARSNARFSHGICPDCVVQLYPDFADGE